MKRSVAISSMSILLSACGVDFDRLNNAKQDATKSQIDNQSITIKNPEFSESDTIPSNHTTLVVTDIKLVREISEEWLSECIEENRDLLSVERAGIETKLGCGSGDILHNYLAFGSGMAKPIASMTIRASEPTQSLFGELRAEHLNIFDWESAETGFPSHPVTLKDEYQQIVLNKDRYQNWFAMKRVRFNHNIQINIHPEGNYDVEKCISEGLEWGDKHFVGAFVLGHGSVCGTELTLPVYFDLALGIQSPDGGYAEILHI